MDQQYKIVLTNHNQHHELTLHPEDKQKKIGTSKSCDLRLDRDLFFSDVELTLTKTNGIWEIACNDEIYLTVDKLMKFDYLDLHHGDTLFIKYKKSNQIFFNVSFTLDFDAETKTYDRCIDITGVATIEIGASRSAQIAIDDPLLTGQKLTLANDNGSYTLTDHQTTYGVYVNGQRIRGSKPLADYDFFSVLGYRFYLKYGKLYTAAADKMRINGLAVSESPDSASCLTYPKFNRNSRVQHLIPDHPIEIKQPPAKQEKPKKNVLQALIPALAMLAIIVLMRDSMGGGGMFILYSGGMMLVGVLMSVVTFMTDGRQYRKDLAKREADYLEYIEEKDKEIAGARENELRVRKAIHTALPESVEEVQQFSAKLFEKDQKDSDFLDIYLGTGTRLAKCQAVSTNKPDFVDAEDPISLLPEKLEAKYRYLQSAPITAALRGDNVLGIVGRRDKLQGMLKNLTLDIAIRHFYHDVKLVYLFADPDEERLTWVRWLGHVQNDELGIRNLLCDEESNKLLLEYLYRILSEREGEAKASEGHCSPHYVVFVFHQQQIAKHPISRYFDRAGKFGFTFVFFEEHEAFLPKGCREIIRLNEHDESASLLFTADAEQQIAFSYETVKDGIAEQVAKKLSPIYIDEVTLESELTRNITLFALLGIEEIGELDLAERWSQSKVYQKMAAPLGVKRKGEVVYLDISDKASAHGPHGLVAGTTGSGKSEILQSYVLSMASLFAPEDVGFLIIDFKGGGMANQFEELPHLLGSITNIDGREINRSLRSIKAELIKRQELFAGNNVNHINDYIRLYKAGKVQTPMPHLIMIVDEFAELKAEFPAFMDEVISAARIGRTLGVHLILATQKPSGVVNEQIWSNSKFKLCLKVQTKEDSSEVIKSPLAAEIVEPGRAYLQVGNNEIFDLFQSAYSGAGIRDGSEEETKPFAIYALNTWGKRELVYTNKRQGEETKRQSQLEAMIQHLSGHCTKAQIGKLQGICMPSLPDELHAEALQEMPLSAKESRGDIRVPLGRFDDPDQQQQGIYTINLSAGNTFLIGTSQMGKTTLLQTMAHALIKHYTPEEVNLYAIDCGNMALKPLEAAKHVGGVAVSAEEEKVEKLLLMLDKEIARRKKTFLDKGLGTYKAYREAGFTDLPQILLLIDNMAAFRELFERLEEQVTTLSREGQSVGITLVVTSAQTNGLGFRALANFGTRIAFTCNDASEYSALFDRCKMEPKDIPGRALCQIDKRILECQIALAMPGEKEIDRVRALSTYIQERNNELGDLCAKSIPQVGEVILADELYRQEPGLFTAPYQIPYGISYDEVEYRKMDLLGLNLLGISGRDKGGKTNFAKYLIHTLDKMNDIAPAQVYILDDDMMELESLSRLKVVAKYMTDPQEIQKRIEAMASELRKRRNKALKRKGKSPEEACKKDPLLVLLIHRRDVISAVEENMETKEQIDVILAECRRFKVLLILSPVDNAVANFNSPYLIQRLAEEGNMLVFEQAQRVRALEIDHLHRKTARKAITKGDAFTDLSGEVEEIKTFLQP
jgi:S-DNA-T family DNA segregation ATPase FtsK/SpoIIIE